MSLDVIFATIVGVLAGLAVIGAEPVNPCETGQAGNC
jgi:hypothetical protein